MIFVTTTRAREDRIAGLRARADGLLHKLQQRAGCPPNGGARIEAIYAGAAPVWWQRIADQTAQAGAVLVLDKGAEQPLVVMTLAAAEALATPGEKGFPGKT